MTIAERLSDIMGPSVACHTVEHDGDEYVVTDGTGEGVFCYDALEVEHWIQCVEDSSYQSFSEHCQPIEDTTLAAACADQTGLTICAAGTCQPIEA